MLEDASEPEILAQKIRHALREAELSDTFVAEKCGVSKQAVSGWKRTGRIRKAQLPVLAQLTGFPVSWLLDPDAPIKIARAAAAAPTATDGMGPDLPIWPFGRPLYKRFTQLAPSDQRDLREALEDHIGRLERRRRAPHKSGAG